MTAFQVSKDKYPNSVYSGSDITLFAVYNNFTIKLGNAHTLSYSVHREKMPVRRLGHAHAVGYTRGTRTIAGSIVFINYDAAALFELFRDFRYDSKDATMTQYGILTDQLPPFDIVLLFQNEMGQASTMRLAGIEIVDEGSVQGVNEQYVETTMQYIARDVTLLRPLPYVWNSIDVIADTELDTKLKKLLFDQPVKQILSQTVKAPSSEHDNSSDALTYTGA